MKLGEVIAKQNEDTVLYIGAISGFFFIGTKVEYERDIKKIERMYYRQYLDNYNSAWNRYYNFLTATEVVIKPLGLAYQRVNGWLEPDQLKDHLAYLTGKFADYVNAEKSSYQSMLNARERFGKQHFPFADRECKSVTPKLLKDEPGLAISLTGDEVGQFWMKAEYDHWKMKQDSYEAFMKGEEA